MMAENCQKILIVNPSYLRGTRVFNMLPWREIGFKAILEMNVCSCVRKIQELKPDILILCDENGWVGAGVVIDTFWQMNADLQVIWLSRGNSLEKKQEALRSTQTLNWHTLTPEQLKAAVLHAREQLQMRLLSQPIALPDERQDDTARLMNCVRKMEDCSFILIRALLEKKPAGSRRQHTVERAIQGFFARSHSGVMFWERDGLPCMLLKVSELAYYEQLRAIEHDLLQLRSQLCKLTQGRALISISNLTKASNARTAYERIRDMEKYRLFCADRPLISEVSVSLPGAGAKNSFNGVCGLANEVMHATVCGDTSRVETALQELFLDNVKPSLEPAYYRIAQNQMHAIYQRLCHILLRSQAEPPGPEEAIWSIEDALALHLQRFTSLIQRYGGHRASINPLVFQAMVIIVDSYAEGLYIGEIAQRLGTSESYLSRLFKQQMGIGLAECMRYLRVYAAADQILHGERSIKALAEKHGFSAPKYFSKVFKETIGVSPSAYIERYSPRKE